MGYTQGEGSWRMAMCTRPGRSRTWRTWINVLEVWDWRTCALETPCVNLVIHNSTSRCCWESNKHVLVDVSWEIDVDDEKGFSWFRVITGGSKRCDRNIHLPRFSVVLDPSFDMPWCQIHKLWIRGSRFCDNRVQAVDVDADVVVVDVPELYVLVNVELNSDCVC